MELRWKGSAVQVQVFRNYEVTLYVCKENVVRRTYFGLVNSPGIDAKNRQSKSMGREATPAGRVTRGASAIERRVVGKGSGRRADSDGENNGESDEGAMVEMARARARIVGMRARMGIL